MCRRALRQVKMERVVGALMNKIRIKKLLGKKINSQPKVKQFNFQCKTALMALQGLTGLDCMSKSLINIKISVCVFRFVRQKGQEYNSEHTCLTNIRHTSESGFMLYMDSADPD